MTRPRENEPPRLKAARAGLSVQQTNPLGYLLFLPRFGELLALGRRLRNCLSTLSLPVYAVLSEADEVVSPRSQQYLNGLPQAHILLLQKSGHYDWPAEEQAQILQHFANLWDSLNHD